MSEYQKKALEILKRNKLVTIPYLQWKLRVTHKHAQELCEWLLTQPEGKRAPKIEWVIMLNIAL